MDSSEIYPLVRRNLVPIGIGIVGFFLIFIGIFQFFGQKKESDSSVVLEEVKSVDKVNEEVIVIDIEGAVMNPGVYKLTAEKRIVDALAAAGGLSEDADRDFVQKKINLAGKLNDGLKIYIPRNGEDILSETKTSDSSAGPVININSASMSDLNALPGIGEVTAQKIIDGRPYASIEELVNKKIIGNATYEKIKDKIAAN